MSSQARVSRSKEMHTRARVSALTEGARQTTGEEEAGRLNLSVIRGGTAGTADAGSGDVGSAIALLGDGRSDRRPAKGPDLCPAPAPRTGLTKAEIAFARWLQNRQNARERRRPMSDRTAKRKCRRLLTEIAMILAPGLPVYDWTRDYAGPEQYQ
jgi:hypothetical protein